MINRRRFLCWNNFGVITSRDEETHFAVEIELSDTTKHKNVRFTDHYNFSMAALCDSGAIFASDFNDE
jgi:chromosome transmission fidelity protein 4